MNPGIFSRSPARGNASLPTLSAAALIVACALGSCTTASTPANVILEDAHSTGDALAFSRDSRVLASAGAEGTIRLWRLPEAAALKRWQAHAGPVQSLIFIERDRAILSVGYDASVAKWDLEGGLRMRTQTPAPIIDMAVDESGDMLVTGHVDGIVRRWRLSDLSLQQEWRLHRGEVRAVAYHAGTRRFASSGTDGQVFFWQQQQTPQRLPPPPTDARGITFSPDGEWLSGGGWFKLFQWRVSERSLTVLPTEHRGIIQSIDYSADGKSLASISRQTDSAVYFLDPATGAVQQRFQKHDLCGVQVKLSPDGRYLASTADDASVRVWDLRQPAVEQRADARRRELSPE